MTATAPSLDPSPSPVDRESVLDRVGGDLDLLREITDIFLQEYPILVDRIGSAINQQDASLLERSAHNLKGCVANFGAKDAVAAAYRLEQMGRQQFLTGAHDALTALRSELERLHPALLKVLV